MNRELVKEGIVMPLEKLKAYVEEYVPNLSVNQNKIKEGFVVELESKDGEVVFRQTLPALSKKQVEKEIVSTAGILDEELSGIVYQSFVLDRRLQAMLKREENERLKFPQFGEN